MFVTGYEYSFPFLSMETDVCLDDEFYVRPLFKHCININRPTMAFVGLQICAYTLMYDMQVRIIGITDSLAALHCVVVAVIAIIALIRQVRLCLKYWDRLKAMPSRERMLEDCQAEMQKQWDKDESLRKAHLLGVDQVKSQCGRGVLFFFY